MSKEKEFNTGCIYSDNPVCKKLKETPNPQTKADTDLGCGLGSIAETGPDDPFYEDCVAHDHRADDRKFNTNPTGENIEQSNEGFFEAMDETEKEIEFQEGVKIDPEIRAEKVSYKFLVNLFTWLGIVK